MSNKKTFSNCFLLLIWMGVIFYLSGQPDLKSGLENQIDFILRKAAHITEYGILTFLAWRAVSESGEKKSIKYLIIAIIFSVFYAMGDEYHQMFVVGRVGSLQDILIDNVGIAVAGIGVGRKFIKS